MPSRGGEREGAESAAHALYTRPASHTATRRHPPPPHTWPTQNVSLRSPCQPSRYAVTSTLTMSPSCSSRASGMPWQMT